MVKKVIKSIILVFFLLVLAYFITVYGVSDLKGLQVTDYSHCGDAYGFPFIDSGGAYSGPLPSGQHPDCFFSLDLISFYLNIAFWFIVLVGVQILIKYLFLNKSTELKNRDKWGGNQ